ncbi:amidase [Oharaeibacter diazotrophicus]|uniref:Amidase/aspartyl-tRNA(Asn)/glutamyl-tRNA(Gln) amidotransferase subunit A n=1 Tax=Oharaeibacter diazotrophicus TaxID=1920512 RepID=A0A4V3CVR5_9HYPH|nr:amidase [Oharaeibacter diazotrophicus]TDP83508.1 amidase/aspartyl-tRNA(Asn)/glutamyl-tRNA(Gln) amidotransferase subunit A [Oharaeibacter diazotrophicus]BBE72341.1 acylamidase [Pleomorphomonas sp. SM30]GLS79111.1 amidase [Oharaeibacter diazotrophicus]
MSIASLVALSVRDLVEAFASGRISPVEAMAVVLDHVEAANPKVNALFSIRPESAFAAARAAEARYRAGRPLGPLDGVPVTVKDSVSMIGWPHTHGIAANADRPPSTYDAPPALALMEGGAAIFAKTTMPDCGLLAAGVSSLHGITRNPWGLAWNTGGSSAGAGASLACGMGFLSVGTDIAGSVRLPAGHCGLASLKPTHGRVAHLPPDTMRMAGPMGRAVEDVARMLSVLTRFDERDTWAFPDEGVPYHDRLDRDPAGLRVGVLADLGFGLRPEPAVLATLERAAALLAGAGAVVAAMPPPFDEDVYAPIDLYLQVRGYLEWSELSRHDDGAIDPTVKAWAMPGRDHSATELYAALGAITRMKARLLQACEPYDYLISPVLPVVNFPAEEPGVFRERPLGHTGFTAVFNQTGQPAATVCMGFDERGLPIGVQVVGRRTDDLGVLQVARILERLRGFSIDWPLEPRA